LEPAGNERTIVPMQMTSFLVCPQCHGDLVRVDAAFNCPRCAKLYPMVDEVPQFDLPNPDAPVPDAAAPAAPAANLPRAADESRDVRRDYWNRGWEARLHGDHAFLLGLASRSEWVSYLQPAIAELTARGHVTCIEANRETLRGRTVLDIGCGGGATSATFGYYGAQYIGLDHSSNAARYSLRHLRGAGGDGFTVQGNAESLPIRDGSIDVVYSNGVLHHTPNFLTAMDEAYRVLRPGGTAIIALYATWSTQFGVLRLLGALRGNLSRKAMERWMGEASEGDWRTGDRRNPWTETFSEAQLRRVVSKYPMRGLSFRKNGSPVGELPRIGAALLRFAPLRWIDRALEPWLGSMLIMSLRK
jgi:ubiquinone/menaquinone biosynthesis C-methylase UbiE